MKWNHTKSGMFEVRSYYQLLSASSNTEFPWKNIWRVEAPHKVAFFTSLAAHGKNLTIDNLRRWQIYVVDGVLCAKGAAKQGIISFFTVSMFGNCGRWFLFVWNSLDYATYGIESPSLLEEERSHKGSQHYLKCYSCVFDVGLFGMRETRWLSKILNDIWWT